MWHQDIVVKCRSVVESRQCWWNIQPLFRTTMVWLQMLMNGLCRAWSHSWLRLRLEFSGLQGNSGSAPTIFSYPFDCFKTCFLCSPHMAYLMFSQFTHWNLFILFLLYILVLILMISPNYSIFYMYVNTVRLIWLHMQLHLCLLSSYRLPSYSASY